jgi:hypothetical protein
VRDDQRIPLTRRKRTSGGSGGTVLLAGIGLYVCGYFGLAWYGQHEGIDQGGGVPKVWAFHGLKDRFHERPHECLSERALFVAFWPMIRLDRAFGNRHALDGGAELVGAKESLPRPAPASMRK